MAEWASATERFCRGGYAALHAFENSVRELVTKAMAEKHGDAWWEKVPERVRKTSKNRMDEDAKFRWHGARGALEINYCDFGGLIFYHCDELGDI